MPSSKYYFILMGALGIFLGFANPFLSMPFLVLLYPFCLYLLVHTSKKYIRDVLVMGTLGYGGAFYWLAITANTYGLIPYFATVFFPLLLGLYFALYGAGIAWYARKMTAVSPLLKACCLALVWYLLEVFRGYFLTGFPWFTLSSAFAPLPVMIQGASIVGAYALSGFFALSAFLLAELFLHNERGFRSRQGKISRFSLYAVQFGGIGILLMLYVYGNLTLKNEMPLTVNREVLHADPDVPYRILHEIPAIKGQSVHSVGMAENSMRDFVDFTIIQGNISQNIKWSPLFQNDSLQKFFRLTDEAAENLQKQNSGRQEGIFIYPESAFPITSYHHRELYEKILAFSKDRTMFFGIPYFADGQYYNSIELLQNERKSGRYSKEHLVPFGEYLPELPLPQAFNDMLARYGGAYSIGVNDKPFLEVTVDKKHIFVLPLICYEAIFPEISYERLQGFEGKTAPILLNISNDAWYDKTSAPYQHLYLSLMRSVETGLYMVRASNTGISAFIDKFGQIRMQSVLFTDESLTVPVPLYAYSPTVFVRIAPYLPFIGMALFLLLHSLMMWRKKLEMVRELVEKTV